MSEIFTVRLENNGAASGRDDHGNAVWSANDHGQHVAMTCANGVSASIVGTAINVGDRNGRYDLVASGSNADLPKALAVYPGVASKFAEMQAGFAKVENLGLLERLKIGTSLLVTGSATVDLDDAKPLQAACEGMKKILDRSRSR